jgi:hypothetical protein
MSIRLVIFLKLVFLSVNTKSQVELIPAKLNFGTTGPSTEWVDGHSHQEQIRKKGFSVDTWFLA